jgi:hypothetical protein
MVEDSKEVIQKTKTHFFNVQFSFAVNIGKKPKDQNCYRNGGRYW